MIFRKYILMCLLLFVSLILLRCFSQRNTSSGKSKRYTVSYEDLLNTQFYFYKNSDTSSIFYFMLNTSPLLYARLDTGMQFYTAVRISVYLNSSENKQDSASKIFYIPKDKDNFFSHLNIHTLSNNYNAKIIITDLNKKMQYSYLTELKLNNDNYRNNFLVTYNDQLLFKPYIPENNTIKIYHYKKYPVLYVDVFKYNHSAAPPPFANITSSFNYLPDSSFTLNITDNLYYLLQIKPNQFYHIRPSQNILDGLTVFSIDSVFPNIKDSKEMLYTSRYIMNKNEFERCNKISDVSETKKCIDNFWIQIAGSKERAKEVLKNYYQRVIEANRLFTSYKYGWQTDRGMIYIVFGPPEDVQRNYYTEKWYYSVNGQKNALVFSFYKNKENLFTTSDFILERSDYYKDMWYIVVDKIRQGRLSTGK